MKKSQLKNIIKEVLSEALSPQDIRNAEDAVEDYMDYAESELRKLSLTLAKKYHSINADRRTIDKLLSDYQKGYPNAYYDILTGRFR